MYLNTYQYIKTKLPLGVTLHIYQNLTWHFQPTPIPPVEITPSCQVYQLLRLLFVKSVITAYIKLISKWCQWGSRVLFEYTMRNFAVITETQHVETITGISYMNMFFVGSCHLALRLAFNIDWKPFVRRTPFWIRLFFFITKAINISKNASMFIKPTEVWNLSAFVWC